MGEPGRPRLGDSLAAAALPGVLGSGRPWGAWAGGAALVLSLEWICDTAKRKKKKSRCH